MARLAGRNGRVYIALTSGGTATPLNFVAKWSVNFKTNKIDVTAMGDTNHVYVNGLPDASGSFSGWYDDGTVQTYTAATDGVARAFYLYPSISNTGQYFWGTVLPDFNIESDVDGAIGMSADFAAASAIAKVG